MVINYTKGFCVTADAGTKFSTPYFPSLFQAFAYFKIFCTALV